MDVRPPFLDRRLGYVTRRWLLPFIGAVVGLVTGEAFADPQTIAVYVFGLFGLTTGFALGLLVAVVPLAWERLTTRRDRTFGQVR